MPRRVINVFSILAPWPRPSASWNGRGKLFLVRMLATVRLDPIDLLVPLDLLPGSQYQQFMNGEQDGAIQIKAKRIASTLIAQ